MKSLCFYLIFYTCSAFGQNNISKEKNMKIYSKSEGLEIIDKYHFKQCSEFKEDDEHIYYDGNKNGFIIFNKYLNDFIFYNSKADFKNVLLKLNTPENPKVDFSFFPEKIPVRIKKLSKILNLELSMNDKLEDLKMVDSKIGEMEKRYTEFPNLFMDFFSYYYTILVNELKYSNIEINEKKNLIEFFIFSNDSNHNKKEIFKNFYKLMVDDDNDSNFYICAKSIIDPLIIKIGNPKESPNTELPESGKGND